MKNSPQGCVLNKQVFIVHGGLFSSDSVRLDDLKQIDRFAEPPGARAPPVCYLAEVGFQLGISSHKSEFATR